MNDDFEVVAQQGQTIAGRRADLAHLRDRLVNGAPAAANLGRAGFCLDAGVPGQMAHVCGRVRRP